MNKTELARKIQALDGLSNEEKTALLELIRGHKKYGLVWEDKPEDIEERLREDLPVLVERNDDKVHPIISDNPDAPNHLIIEGDNLAALTELSYTHAGKIDVIYIDPPYNTGNKDFAYYDDFSDDYRKIPYVDRVDCYRHSKWLSFMERRLSIAKVLLKDSGIIFISIDDNEQANLKLLCDEIFGEQSLLAQLIWKSKSGGANDATAFGIDHEYVLCYCINSSRVHINNDLAATVTTSYNKVDEDGRRYSLDRLDKQSLGYQASLDFPIIGPDGRVYSVEHKDPNHKKARWRWGKDTVRDRYDELVFSWPYIYTKNYEKTDGQKPRSILFDERFGRTRTGSTDLNKVVGNQNIFNYPKPQNLIRFLVQIGGSKEAEILDFFAGSGTTLHAVMQLNAEDGGKRQCILCTNNENGICENVTYERNKRVIEGYTKPNGEDVAGLGDNNLRYYHTEFLPRERSVKNMRELVKASTGLLCIKNDLYTEAPFGVRKMNPKYARYFENAGRRMLVVYEERAIPFIADIIKTMPEGEKIKVYVFSHGCYAYDDEFADVADRVTLCALPQAIYDAYQKVLPKRKLKFLVDDLVEEIVENEQQETAGIWDFDNEKGGDE